MSTFDEDDESIEDSQPRECVEIKHGSTVYRYAMGSESLKIDGNKFDPYPVGRGELELAFFDEDKDLRIKLPTTDPFSRRWWRLCIPPRSATVTVYRFQLAAMESARMWQGLVESSSIDGSVAMFRIPAISNAAGRRRLPVITVGRQCPYILYESGCRTPRTAFRVVTTCQSKDGTTVKVASMATKPDHWADFGELVHVPSGERMTISEQIGTTLTIQLPIIELNAGDAVQVFAGCGHTVDDCRDKFNNLKNFGGFPHMPRGNIFLPLWSGGVYQSNP